MAACGWLAHRVKQFDVFNDDPFHQKLDGNKAILDDFIDILGDSRASETPSL